MSRMHANSSKKSSFTRNNCKKPGLDLINVGFRCTNPGLDFINLGTRYTPFPPVAQWDKRRINLISELDLLIQD